MLFWPECQESRLNREMSVKAYRQKSAEVYAKA
jgi:hypothetical protein